MFFTVLLFIFDSCKKQFAPEGRRQGCRCNLSQKSAWKPVFGRFVMPKGREQE
jgi:hypothetical protein